LSTDQRNPEVVGNGIWMQPSLEDRSTKTRPKRYAGTCLLANVTARTTSNNFQRGMGPKYPPRSEEPRELMLEDKRRQAGAYGIQTLRTALCECAASPEGVPEGQQGASNEQIRLSP